MPKQVLFILPTDKHSGDDIFPCIAVEGERGYYRTDWNWGKDVELAERLCAERNAKVGINQEDAITIILGTMR